LEWIEYLEDDRRYTPKNFYNGFGEDLPINFQSPYGCSKGAADQYLSDYSRIYGIKTVVLRHSSMYGGRQFPTNDQGWIGWFCQKAINQKRGLQDKFSIFGNGKQVRDILHCDDMVNLYIKVSQNILELSGEVFNIGGGIANSLSLLELFSMLEDRLNIKLTYDRNTPRISDQKYFVADIRKIEKFVQWSPKINCNHGIDMMLEWVAKK
jgi:CDP-paratose 2-epimerase